MGKYDRSLAQFLSKKKEHKPFAKGSARQVFYSPTHKVVFKIARNASWAAQQGKEARFFESLSKAERKYLPIREVVYYQDQPILVMDMATVDWNDPFNTYYNHPLESIVETILEYGRRKNVQISNAVGAARFIKKYELSDLDYRNVGLIGNRFVIVDAGLMHSDF